LFILANLLAGHGCMLQSTVSKAAPMQALPPFCGVGSMHSLLLLSRPPSQVKEQLSNSAHWLHPPSEMLTFIFFQ
jgi:hypothetical protein